MAKEIKMPQLSDTMDSGKIITWLKAEGDSLTRGDILAEVETDKANLEIESFDEGTLLKIAVAADETAQVGEVIAVIGAEGEAVSTSSSSKETASEAPVAEPAKLEETNVEKEEVSIPTATEAAPSLSNEGRIKASPLAKKIAKEKNIDLNDVQGSGPNGRIVSRDIETGNPSQPVAATAPAKAIQQPTAVAAPATKSAPTNGGQLIELDRMRSTIAKRMQESMQQSPHFYMTTSIDMRESKKLREGLKIKEEFKGLSLNHFIIKAAAYALSKEPAINAAMQGDKIFQPDNINVGVITAVDGGLLIPVVHQADKMSLKDLAFEVRAMISRARAGRPSSQDLSGGTFSISNMGMFDVENFTAIINPGQGAIMAVSGMKETPIVTDSEFDIGLEMKVTLSVDHRIIDGVTVANFLKAFKEALEFPALLLI